jgi:hypothetical protein
MYRHDGRRWQCQSAGVFGLRAPALQEMRKKTVRQLVSSAYAKADL